LKGSVKMVAPAVRAANYVEEDRGYTSPCWVWQGALNNSGYGKIGGRFPGDRDGTMSHRYHYERVYGAIPEGLQVDHLCRIRACVNPAHLELVTPAENIRRGELTKLTERDVRDIRALGRPAKKERRQLAARYGVSLGCIDSLIWGQSWRNVQCDAPEHVRDQPDGAKIKRLRRAAGMSQQALADACGISDSTVSRIEANWAGQTPHAKTIAALACALRVNPKELLVERMGEDGRG
jgi:DNA-binding XRE family transcriptional regulator